MVIDDEAAAEDNNDEMGEDVAGAAYRESLISADGFTRGANGRVKFNKDTKKRRRENEDTEDVEMTDALPAATTTEKKRHQPKFGHEFKAKVWEHLSSTGTHTNNGLSDRKLVGILRRVGWTHTLICPSPKRRRRKVVPVLLARGNVLNMLLQAERKILYYLCCCYRTIRFLPSCFCQSYASFLSLL
jgi:hypothetical protein